MKLKIKLISILLVLIQIIGMLVNLNVVKATINEGDTLLLKGDHECDSLVEYWMEDYQKWSYKIVWYVYYLDTQTGKKYPAFCVEPAKQGVGTGYSEYNTTISRQTDNAIWRILDKGYMGSSYRAWGMTCDDDLYSATKIALHSYAEKIAPKDKYRIGTRSVDGNTVEEIQKRGTQVLDIAQALYLCAINNTDVYKEPKCEIQKNGSNTIETINGEEYYVQKYLRMTNKPVKSYEISIENFISGTKILNLNNEENSTIKESFFKIAIPIKSIKENICGKVSLKNIDMEDYQVFYAKSSIANAQSYVTYTDTRKFDGNTDELILESNNSNLEILKIDSKTKEPIANVTFQLTDESEKVIGEYTTNEEGLIEINNLHQGTVKVKEIKAPDKYIINEQEQTVNLEWNKTTRLELENDRKKGEIKIIKTDKEDTQKRLKDVVFELYDENENLVTTLTTNDNGEALAKDLNIGKYTLKEVKTNEEYVLMVEDISTIIKWNDQTQIIVENGRKKGELKITKVNSENKEEKIEGVEFELYNEEDELIKKLITNENGEAFAKDLDIGNYKLKEVKTNKNYVLNDEEIKVTIEWNNETNIVVENQKSKGKIKITKLSADDNIVTGEKAGSAIKNVEFEIKNEEGNIVENVVTDENGEIVTKELPIGKYTIKETKANENYELDETEYTVEISQNKQLVELTITNKSKEKLPRTGF